MPGYLEHTDEQLDRMSHQALWRHYRAVRARASMILNFVGPRCCEICHEYIGSNWERDVGQYLRPVHRYQNRVLEALQRRPFVDFSKEGQAKARKEYLGGLKGNRRPRNRHHRKHQHPSGKLAN